MSKDKKLIPELRFPEFVKKEEWDNDTLDKICLIIKGEQLSRIELTAKGKYACQNGGINPSGYTDRYNTEGQTITISEGGNSCGYVNFMSSKFWLGGHCYKLEILNDIDIFFLYYLLKFNEHRLMKLRVGSGLPNIQQKALRNFIVPYTTSLVEQRKIASSLSSLDEVISYQSQKLDLLKDHKKGLMQSLFPQEGQKVPKYRFTEFVNDGEWEEKELSEIGKLVNGLTYSPNDVREKGLLVLRSSNIQNGLIELNDNVYVKSDMKGANISKPNDILICVRNGSKVLIGKNAIIPKGIPFATHGAFMTVFRSKIPEFVYQLFQTNVYDKQVKADLGATINSINGKNLLKYKFLIPKNPKEKQKIASSLSTLDDMIIAQTEKIERLKLHKKGLMQGLFPKI